MTDPTSPPTRGRRVAAVARSRPDVTVLLAVVLPLVTVGALVLVRAQSQEIAAAPPERTALTMSTIVCPGGAQAALSTMSETPGEVAVRAADADEAEGVALTPGAVTELPGEGPVAATGEGNLAPGLLGGVFASPLAAAACHEPASDQWFTGLGAGARHSSVLELVNPDAGPAVVDAVLVGADGPVDAPELRGVAVPARGVVRIALATTIPRRDELALRVTTSRGRVSATVRDRYDQLGAGAAAADWLPAQLAPATSNLMLGLVPGDGLRNLVLSNPGTDETRASVKVVTKQSVFTPKGAEDIIVPPGAVTRDNLSELFPADALKGAVGLLVTSSAPLTSTVRSFVEGDLSHTTSGVPVTSAAALAPTGDKRVTLAGATGAGTVTIIARNQSGGRVTRQRIDVAADRGFTVSVPPEATLVELESQGTSIIGSVVISGDGATVIPLTQLVRDNLVAQVRPGL